MSGKTSFGRFLRENAVILLFLVITVLAIRPSGLSLVYIGQEMITRLGRDSFLVLALLLPIYAGMGLNFGMTLGAMAGQFGLILAINYNLLGVYGLVFAALASLPMSLLMGYICGVVLNKAKGREMVTGYILAFFINGIYQFVVLYLMGSVIPVRSKAIVLSRGYGIRNTLNLDAVRQSLDNLLRVPPGPFDLPVATFLVIAALCAVHHLVPARPSWARTCARWATTCTWPSPPACRWTAPGSSPSSSPPCWPTIGQIIFLQNMGNMATYNAHDQTSFFAVAAILVGGASVKKATIPNVFIGVILLHVLFVVSPGAGQKLFGEAMIGEYFRQFIGYGVIAVSLVLYAWRTRRETERARAGAGLRGGGAATAKGGAQ